MINLWTMLRKDGLPWGVSSVQPFLIWVKGGLLHCEWRMVFFEFQDLRVQNVTFVRVTFFFFFRLGEGWLFREGRATGNRFGQGVGNDRAFSILT